MFNNNDLNIDDNWENFLEREEILDHNNNDEDYNYDNKKNEIIGDLYVSTKTKIGYLNQNIDISKIFWKIPIILFYKQEEGIIKKQMKFNSVSKDELNVILQKSKSERNVEQHIISKIENNRRIQYKDIRKISIGLSNKDIISDKYKKKSAFYNCFVVIMRINIDNVFKEFHVKVFNTGKLEIPGIREERYLIKILDLLVSILNPIMNNSVNYLPNNTETVLVNSNFNCGFYINREKFVDILKKKYNIKCSYDSCQYPGIQCKYIYTDEKKKYNMSFMIFRTGSILIVGKCNNDILYKVYDYIKNIINIEKNNIYIPPNQDNLKLKKKKRKKLFY